MSSIIFSSMRQSVIYFIGAGKFCLAHGLRQLTLDVKTVIRILNFRSDVNYVLPQKHRMTFVEGRNMT